MPSAHGAAVNAHDRASPLRRDGGPYSGRRGRHRRGRRARRRRRCRTPISVHATGVSSHPAKPRSGARARPRETRRGMGAGDGTRFPVRTPRAGRCARAAGGPRAVSAQGLVRARRPPRRFAAVASGASPNASRRSRVSPVASSRTASVTTTRSASDGRAERSSATSWRSSGARRRRLDGARRAGPVAAPEEAGEPAPPPLVVGADGERVPGPPVPDRQPVHLDVDGERGPARERPARVRQPPELADGPVVQRGPPAPTRGRGPGARR